MNDFSKQHKHKSVTTTEQLKNEKILSTNSWLLFFELPIYNGVQQHFIIHPLNYASKAP